MLRHLLVAPAGRRSCLLRQVVLAAAPTVSAAGTTAVSEPILRRNFSSPAPQSSFKIPSNLKIDPRSSFAPTPRKQPKPTPIGSDKKEEETEQDEDAESSAVKQEQEEEEDAFTAEYSSEDDEEEDIELFIRQPELLYAKPLPDRLNVEIQTFFAPVYDSTVGTIWLDENVFGRDPIRVDLLKRAVLYYRNKKTRSPQGAFQRYRRGFGIRTKASSSKRSRYGPRRSLAPGALSGWSQGARSFEFDGLWKYETEQKGSSAGTLSCTQSEVVGREFYSLGSVVRAPILQGKTTGEDLGRMGSR
mmetsp:Transcript_8425/g.16091  ORF Transcript_8425/g.16091 Transcript_8425/m.16091 type:complete len:302 (-) Transcript_8425:396-1301(-)